MRGSGRRGLSRNLQLSVALLVAAFLAWGCVPPPTPSVADLTAASRDVIERYPDWQYVQAAGYSSRSFDAGEAQHVDVMLKAPAVEGFYLVVSERRPGETGNWVRNSTMLETMSQAERDAFVASLVSGYAGTELMAVVGDLRYDSDNVYGYVDVWVWQRSAWDAKYGLRDAFKARSGRQEQWRIGPDASGTKAWTLIQ